MRNKEYNALFRDMARRHIDIQHTEKECRFLRMTLSSDPVARMLDLREFYDALAGKLKLNGKCAMVLQSYEADYNDNEGDHYTKEFIGGMIILGKVKQGDYDQQEEVQDKTEEIGEDILGMVLEQFGASYSPHRHMTASDISSQKVGPVGDNFYGTRFDFSFSEPAGQALIAKPEKFID
ncbi:MAG: hypothetical protein LPK01_00320 [Hymenobacteraceae bacterium]|nr:hypothetical protein [Hymenobacteraceae bacterium]